MFLRLLSEVCLVPISPEPLVDPPQSLGRPEVSLRPDLVSETVFILEKEGHQRLLIPRSVMETGVRARFNGLKPELHM